MSTTSLEKALFDDAGNPREIERIEIQMAGSRFRWLVFAGGGEQVFCTPAVSADQIAGMIAATEQLVRAQISPAVPTRRPRPSLN